MSIRDYGALDTYLAGMVMHSKLSSKVQSFSLYGYNPDVDTASVEDVWEVGGTYSYLTIMQPLSIASTDATDAVGLAGIEQVRLTGVDDDYNPVSEIVDLNGLSPVTTMNKYLRVNSMTGIKTGSADYNIKAAGTITASFSGNIQSQISQDRTTARQAFFTTYAGYTSFIKQIWVSGGSNDDYVARFAVRPENGIFTIGNDFETTNNEFIGIGFNPGVGNIAEKSDIKFEAQAISNNAQVRVNFTLISIETKYLEALAASI